MFRFCLFILLLVVLTVNSCNVDKSTPVQVCVKQHNSFNYCGSGFFISETTMVTAAHIVEQSVDGLITVRGAFFDRQSKQFGTIPQFDVAFIHFLNKVSEYPYPICNSVKLGSDVVAYGIVKLKKGVEKRKLVVDSVSMSTICMIGEVQRGFSGGPVVDVDRSCVIGLVSSRSSNSKFIKAVNLTNDDWNWSFSIREFRMEKK